MESRRNGPQLSSRHDDDDGGGQTEVNSRPNALWFTQAYFWWDPEIEYISMVNTTYVSSTAVV